MKKDDGLCRVGSGGGGKVFFRLEKGDGKSESLLYNNGRVYF